MDRGGTRDRIGLWRCPFQCRDPSALFSPPGLCDLLSHGQSLTLLDHSPTLSHSAEMPSSRAASEILYVVRLFSFISLRYWVPGYFGTGISKGSQFRYWDSGAKAPEDPCTSAYTFVGCGTVTADEGVTTPSAPSLAIRGPAARIAEAPGARSSVGRAPPSHGGGQGFESPRVHSLFLRICR